MIVTLIAADGNGRDMPWDGGTWLYREGFDIRLPTAGLFPIVWWAALGVRIRKRIFRITPYIPIGVQAGR